jgi:hypothetical protein
LMMNMHYNGLSRELEKFTWLKREMDLVPTVPRVGGLFIDRPAVR